MSFLRFGKQLLSPITGAARWYVNTAKEHPVITAVVTTGIKTSAADAFAQKVVEGKEEMDWRRHAVFCTFGLCYLGGFQYWLYNIKFTQWCGPITAVVGHRGVAPLKTFLDQAIHHPFIYFPVFYSLKATVEGKPLSYAAEKYHNEIWDSCKALWSVWVPAQIINFAFVPRHLRIPYVAAVSFGWTVILSTMQGKFDSKKLQEAEYSETEVLEQRKLQPKEKAPIGLSPAAAAALEKRQHHATASSESVPGRASQVAAVSSTQKASA